MLGDILKVLWKCFLNLLEQIVRRRVLTWFAGYDSGMYATRISLSLSFSREVLCADDLGRRGALLVQSRITHGCMHSCSRYWSRLRCNTNDPMTLITSDQARSIELDDLLSWSLTFPRFKLAGLLRWRAESHGNRSNNSEQAVLHFCLLDPRGGKYR